VYDLLAQAAGKGNTTAAQYIKNLGGKRIEALKAARSNKDVYDLLKQ
jgi:hypothetical protein